MPLFFQFDLAVRGNLPIYIYIYRYLYFMDELFLFLRFFLKVNLKELNIYIYRLSSLNLKGSKQF